MCDMSDVSSALKVVGTASEIAGASMAAKNAGKKSALDKQAYTTQADVTERNAALERTAATDAIQRGGVEMTASRMRTNQAKGQQIAMMASNGLDLSEGTPLDILSSTDLAGITDSNVIAMNASKEAYGYSIRAENDDENASLLRTRASQEDPGRAVRTSLLTSAGSVSQKWYSSRHPYG